jgi:hypothetical protein
VKISRITCDWPRIVDRKWENEITSIKVVITKDFKVYIS